MSIISQLKKKNFSKWNKERKPSKPLAKRQSQTEEKEMSKCKIEQAGYQQRYKTCVLQSQPLLYEDTYQS